MTEDTATQEDKENLDLALTYQQPKAWAIISPDRELLAFSYKECVKASQSEDNQTATYASVMLRLIDIALSKEASAESLREALEFDNRKEEEK